MVSARAVIENILALILVIACTIVWVAHSQYFYMKFADRKTNMIEKEDPPTALAMPNIILCSRSPLKTNAQYTSNTPFVQYLEEEIDPNIVNMAGRIPLNGSNLGVAEQSFLNIYPAGNIAYGKSVIQSLLFTCLDVIYNCTWQGITQLNSGCCSMVNTNIPTMDGICWSLTGNTSYTGNTQFLQNSTGNRNGFTFSLAIDQYKYQRPSLTGAYPGFDIYLSDTKDMWRLINELKDPVYVGSGEGVRINIQKTVTTKTDTLECGMSVEKAAQKDMDAMTDPSQTPLAACVLDAAISRCTCHPLLSEFLDIDRNRNPDFDRLWNRINNNNARPCTTSAMSTCIQPYMSYLQPENYEEPPTGTSDVMMDVKNCMAKWHKPCQTVSYTITPEFYALPQQQFVTNAGYQAEFTVAYSSLKVTQTVESYDMNIIDLASYIGFAAALWFTVGHIIWSIARVFKSMCCKRDAVVVDAKKERAPLTPYVNQHGPEIYQNPPATAD